MDDIATTVIDVTRQRVVRAFPAQVRECLDLLTDEQIWWRPNDASNSVGNLVLHLCGATRHFLGRGVGNGDFKRDRAAEFAERGPLPKAELYRALDEAVAEADRVFAALRAERLAELTDRAGEPLTVLSILFRMSHHWAYHAGQIVWATKALREGAVDELWRRTVK